ncbi:MAG: radical SAM protein [Methanoregula sp.]|nr:radical SAM protein [Methanoregula sp.]
MITILIHKQFPKQHYFTLFNPKTGFFLRMEDPGFLSPYWSECGPELLDISITRWCDKGCPRCYRESNTAGKHMSINNYRYLLDQVKKMPVNQIALGGGNPNQHPDFCEILQVTRQEYGIVPSYTSNGRGLTQEILDSSREYCGAVAISAYPPYNELENAIEKLTSNGIKTNIHFVLDKDSISTAINWMKAPLAFLSIVNAIIFLNYKPLGRIEKTVGRLNESDKLKLFFDEIQKNHSFKIGFDSCCVSGLATYTETSPLFYDGCDAGRFSMFISEDMKAYPCSFMIHENRGYDLKKHRIIDVWKKGKEFKNIRERKWNNKCNNCSKKQICLGGCPNWNSINLC